MLLITVDGFSVETLDAMLAAGELPNVAGLIDRGVRVGEARCSLPSLTYPNLTTILTGVEPFRHGVLGNKWFDRYSLVYRNYTTMADYRLADGDFSAPTVFERLGEDYGVSIQCAVRRGAERIIDNWASSGLRWLVGAYEATDQLIPLRLDIIAEEASRRGRWPALIHAYFPGADEIGHRQGRDSARYRAALANIDRQIGLMLEAVGQAGMAERTCTILVSDHNHTPVPPENGFDVAGWLRRYAGLRVLTEAPPHESWEARRRRYANVDAVVVTGGDRFAAVHLRGPNGWHQRPARSQLDAMNAAGITSLPKRKEIAAAAWTACSPEGSRLAFVESRDDRWNLSRRGLSLAGEALMGWLRLSALPIPVDSDLDGRPKDRLEQFGLVPAIDSGGDFKSLAGLFDSPRAGDLILFAAEGWDFVPGGAGGHGGLGEADTRVPMIFSGPRIDPSAVIESARLVDVTPTILGLLGKLPADAIRSFDGQDRSVVLTGDRRKSAARRWINDPP